MAEGILDEARQQATAAPVASDNEALDVQRSRIIRLLRSRGVATRPSWNYFELLRALDPELQNWFYDDGWLHHPLIIEPRVNASRIPYINDSYREKKAGIKQAERDANWQQFIDIHERPYRFKALRKALRRIKDSKEAAYLVGYVWTDNENIRQHRSAWLSIWTGLDDCWAAMEEEEQAALAKFPNKLKIFRGCGGRRGLTNGLSWTMDRYKAKYFAHRFSEHGPPFVASGWVFKDDVFAYFTRRKESEIVVSPVSVLDVVVTPLPQ